MGAKKLIFILIFLILISLVNAENSITDTLEEGATKIYVIGGNNYEITVSLVHIYRNFKQVQFIINNKLTSTLTEGDIYKISDNVELRILRLSEKECGEAAGCDEVEFKLTHIVCGDGICNENENCIEDDCCNGQKCSGNGICDPGETCEEDNCCNGQETNFLSDEDNCGKCNLKCSRDEKCKNGECMVSCGDSYCDSDETCEKDNCCEGQKTYLSFDEDNCGRCGRECDSDERCVRGKCVTYCGNGICESDESYENCSRDCEPPSYIPPKEEKEDIPIKEESKKCENGCVSNEECFPKGTSGFNKNQPVYCDGNHWIIRKGLNENCEFDYECKINSCINGICKEKEYIPSSKTEPENIISKVLNWFKKLF